MSQNIGKLTTICLLVLRLELLTTLCCWLKEKGIWLPMQCSPTIYISSFLMRIVLQVVSGLLRPLGQWRPNQRAEFLVVGRLQELRVTRRPLGLWVQGEEEPLLEAWEAHKVSENR